MNPGHKNRRQLLCRVTGEVAHSTRRCDNRPNYALLFGGICIQPLKVVYIVAPGRHGAVFGLLIWWLTP